MCECVWWFAVKATLWNICVFWGVISKRHSKIIVGHEVVWLYQGLFPGERLKRVQRWIPRGQINTISLYDSMYFETDQGSNIKSLQAGLVSGLPFENPWAIIWSFCGNVCVQTCGLYIRHTLHHLCLSCFQSHTWLSLSLNKENSLSIWY